MGLTLVEKIAARHADGLPAGTVVRSGDFISIRPRHVMTHDNTGAVIPKFKQIGATAIADPAQPVFAIDHDIQNTSPENLAKYAKIEAFAREHGIDFYPAGTGISHQVMVEQGYVVPGAFVVASDSHSNLYGAIAALGTPVVRTDAASIWATGVTWWQVPKVARVLLKGNLSAGVVGKDVIIALCGLFNKDEVLNHAVEFLGDGVASLPMSARMTIANMTTEWGALAGVFPFDEVTVNYLRSRVPEFTNPKRPGTRGPKSRSGYTNADIDAWWKNRREISATNRNFKGRMGDLDAYVYLGSPAVVAASALAGFICAPKNFTERAAGTAVRRAQSKTKPPASVEIMAGFPPSVRGRVLFIDKDNLNTDGIYGSKHTYRDDMTPEEMATVTFENYDPNFNTLYQKGDVVVGGLNFGSGSSRDQAAT